MTGQTPRMYVCMGTLGMVSVRKVAQAPCTKGEESKNGEHREGRRGGGGALVRTAGDKEGRGEGGRCFSQG